MANVVEIRGRLTGTDFFDFAHVTPATPGMNAVVTSVVDANGLVPGMVGYVGPTVQVPLLKIVSDDIISTDLTANAYTFNDGDVDAVAIKNDGTSDLTATIDTLLFTLKPGESRILELAPFDTVTFSANATFRMNGLRRS